MSVSEAATVEHKRTPRRAKRSTSSRAQRPRSAVTSGRQLFISGDPNSAWSRRYHDLVVGHCNDIGPGPDLLSEAQLSLIRRAASIECELERLDAMLSTGAEVNLDAYGRAASHLRRLFETLGVGRKARDVTLGGSVEVLEPPLSPMRNVGLLRLLRLPNDRCTDVLCEGAGRDPRLAGLDGYRQLVG